MPAAIAFFTGSSRFELPTGSIAAASVVVTAPIIMAMVSQSYAIYPHMTVRENMGFPLKLAGLPRNEITRRVEQAADTLELRALLERKPRSLEEF